MELPFLPYMVGFGVLGLVLLAQTGHANQKDDLIQAATQQQARSAAVETNGIDPSTGEAVAQKLANEISSIVPVSNVSITYSSTPPTLNTPIGMKDLLINVNLYDGSDVTTTVLYGMQMPANGIFQSFGFTQQTPIPEYAQYSYYREW